MKKLLLLTMLIFITIFFVPSTSTGNTPRITLFGTTVLIANPLQLSGHDANFLQYLNINQIYWVYSYNNLNSEMDTIFKILMNNTVLPHPVGIPSKIMIYTTNQTGSNQIQLSQTHAFSVIMLSQGQLKHFYFERQNSTFNEIISLRTQINGKISDGIIRAIHFAVFSNAGLPTISSVYVLQSNNFNLVQFNDMDNNLTKKFAADHNRQAGFSTIGIVGDSIFISAGLAAGGGCDNRCANGYAGCVMGDCGGENNPPGSAMTSALNTATALNIHLGVHFDFILSRIFRDNFLRQYEQGRDYIGFYYIFSRFAKMDVTSLFQYANVLPHIYTAMNALMSTTGNPVIITPELRNSALVVINNHRNIQDTAFQNILNRVESGLNFYVGMNKSDLMATLVPVGSVAIPTIKIWGLIIIGVVLLGLGTVYMIRRRAHVRV